MEHPCEPADAARKGLLQCFSFASCYCSTTATPERTGCVLKRRGIECLDFKVYVSFQTFGGLPRPLKELAKEAVRE